MRKRFSTVLSACLMQTALFAAPASGQDAVKVGVIQPQAGDCAQWGVPITRGIELWAEEINEQGGIQVGDGVRYPISVQAYDNVCYIPGEELKAARRAVLDDEVEFILQTFTPASRKAIAALVDKNQVLTTSYGAGFLSPDFGYLIGSITGSPTSHMFIASQIASSSGSAR